MQNSLLRRSAVVAIVAAFLAMLSAGFAGSVAAQEAGNELSCGTFESQASAQESLDEFATDDPLRDILDGDGNGLACDQLGEGFEECSDFATQDDAQAFVNGYAEGGIFPFLEDDDADGFYCEAFFGAEVDEDTDSPDTGTEDSTDPAVEGEDDATPEAAADDDAAVSGLPSTGTGEAAGTSAWMIGSTVAAAMALLALTGRTLAARRR